MAKGAAEIEKFEQSHTHSTVKPVKFRTNHAIVILNVFRIS